FFWNLASGGLVPHCRVRLDDTHRVTTANRYGAPDAVAAQTHHHHRRNGQCRLDLSDERLKIRNAKIFRTSKIGAADDFAFGRQCEVAVTAAQESADGRNVNGPRAVAVR